MTSIFSQVEAGTCHLPQCGAAAQCAMTRELCSSTHTFNTYTYVRAATVSGLSKRPFFLVAQQTTSDAAHCCQAAECLPISVAIACLFVHRRVGVCNEMFRVRRMLSELGEPMTHVNHAHNQQPACS